MFVCCIIKPPRSIARKGILQELTRHGLVIKEVREFCYDAHAVDVLYDHMDTEARACIAQKYGGCIGAALLIEAESIEACTRIIGTESDPRACGPDTIRFLYGSRCCPEQVGRWQWWENALHRPVNERERLRDMLLVFPEYVEGAG